MRARWLAVALLGISAMMAWGATASGVTTVFFSPSQTGKPGTSGSTYDTVLSEGYSFQYTADKYWSPIPSGPPTGRFFTVFWPDGVQAQAVTSGPAIGPAQIVITRLDGAVFDLPELTFKLLANTAGAGGTMEIMPLLNGNDGYPNPVTLDATGIAGNIFHYDQTPRIGGSTALLHGFDTYQLSLYVDFALLSPTTLVDASVAGDVNGDGLLNADDYARIDRGYAKGLTSRADGDLNWDGVINAQDYLLLDTAWAAAHPYGLSSELLARRQAQFGSAYVTELVAAIPEPAAAIAVGTAIPLAAGRRRRAE